MVKIEIQDPSNVLIDGENAGQIMDVVRNHPQHASDVQRAFAAWHKDQLQKRIKDNEELTNRLDAFAKQEAEKAAAAFNDRHESVVNRLTEVHNEAIIKLSKDHEIQLQRHRENAESVTVDRQVVIEQMKEMGAVVKGMEEELSRRQSLIDALGGTKLAQRFAKEKRLAELKTARDAIEQEHAELTER